MAHIHELIDFVVVVFIVFDSKVLLIKHKSLGLWLPIGGHIELNENPDEAIMREIKEECGLEVEIINEKPKLEFDEFKFLRTPSFLDIHKINDTHQHINFTYFAKAKNDSLNLNKDEHDSIRWFNEEDLENSEYNLRDNIKFLCREALKTVK